MSGISINSNKPDPIQNGDNTGINKGNVLTRWSNSIFIFVENGDNEVGWEDLQNEQNRGDDISKGAERILAMIENFFTENKGQKWTTDLTDKLNRLLEAFNIKNKIGDRKTEEYFNEDNQMTGCIAYDSEGKVFETSEYTYDSEGKILLSVTKDANGDVTYESYFEEQPDGTYEEIDITPRD